MYCTCIDSYKSRAHNINAWAQINTGVQHCMVKIPMCIAERGHITAGSKITYGK